MGLPRDLIKDFVKSTDDSKKKKESKVVYGTIKTDSSNVIQVKVDGSDAYIPIVASKASDSTNNGVKVSNGDRVRLLQKNHKLEILSNITAPSMTANSFKGKEFTGNKFKSENFSDGGTYATAGMMIDFANGFIKAKNFAVDSSGYIHAKSGGDIGTWKLDSEGLYGAYGSGANAISASLYPSGISFDNAGRVISRITPSNMSIGFVGTGGVVTEYGILNGHAYSAPLDNANTSNHVIVTGATQGQRISHMTVSGGYLIIYAENGGPVGSFQTYRVHVV